MNKNKTIIFFYPSRVVGGAEYLFMRSALYMTQQLQLDVKYIDYPDGFVAKQLVDTNVELLLFEDYRKIQVPCNATVISPFSSIFDVVFDLRGDFKVLFWSIHPVALSDTIKSNARFSKSGRAKLYREIQLLIDKQAVCFMDGSNLDYQKKEFEFVLEKEDFVPIFCLEKNTPSLAKKTLTDVIHLGWLGRLCKEKVHPLINVLRHLKEYAVQHTTASFVFHIIGNGEEQHLVEMEQMPLNVEVRFLGVLTGVALEEYIYTNIDVMFGMGTSTLEVASLHKAVVLVDFSFNEMELNNRFRWLYESERYSVGDAYSVDAQYNHSLEDIIHVVKEGELSKIEELCYRYFELNHSVEKVCESLIVKCDQSLLTNKMLLQTSFKKFGLIYFLKKVNKIRKKWMK